MKAGWKCKFCCLSLIFIPLMAIGILFYLTRPLKSGNIKIDAGILGHEVEIEYDKYGIPYITATTLDDAYFGLGYTHAADRLWELNVKKMLVSGRLAEIFGEDAVDVDKSMRIFGLSRIAQENIKHLSQDTIKTIESYIAGVNAFVNNSAMLPIEFTILQTTFEEYTILDVMTQVKFLELHLSDNWNFEITRTALADKVGTEMAERLLPTKDSYNHLLTTIQTEEDLKEFNKYSKIPHTTTKKPPVKPIIPNNNNNITNNITTSEEMNPNSNPNSNSNSNTIDLEPLSFYSGPEHSDSWAISGTHSSTGYPLISNDPHLGLKMPSVWYLAYMEVKEGDSDTIVIRGKGGTMVGMPGIFAGRNEQIAWGVTSLLGEDSDAYSVVLDAGGENYWYDGGWVGLRVYREVIRVKGGEDVYYVVKNTHHGPLLYDLPKHAEILFCFGSPSFIKSPIAVAWTGFRKRDKAIVAMIQAIKSVTIQDLIKFTADDSNINQSLLFAMKNGSIGVIGVGTFPRRRSPKDAIYIREGWNPKDDWKEYMNISEYTMMIDPSKGYIVSCNNKHSTDNSISGLGTTIPTTARAARATQIIEQYIKNHTKMGIEDFINMQNDSYDIYAKDMLPMFIKLLQQNKVDDQALQKSLDDTIKLLNNWDFRTTEDSKEALIFNVWETELAKLLFAQEFPNEYERLSYIGTYLFDHFLIKSMETWARGEDLDNKICINIYSKGIKTPCAYNFLKAIQSTFDYLHKHMGDNEDKWEWGRLHQFVYPHTPFSRTILKFLYDRSRPAAGNKRTLYVSQFKAKRGNYETVHAANFRFVASMHDFEEAYFSVDTGQSGDVLSANYDNMIDIHHDLKLIKITKPNSSNKLLLIPKQLFYNLEIIYFLLYISIYI